METLTQSKPSNRLTELDGLRGFLLLVMTVNHMPSPLREHTSQPFGFTSAAEGFVFLSAFLAALIFHRRSAKVGPQASRRALYDRAGVVLRAHYITMVFAFVVLGWWLAPMIPAFKNMVWPIVDMPGRAILGSVFLLYQPPVLDILPLYVMLLAITPFVLWASERFGWRYVLVGSAALWALSQRPPLKLELLNATKLGHPWDFGYFDQFAWQFLWVLGLALGTYFYRKPADKPLIDWSRIPVGVAAAFVAATGVFFFTARHGITKIDLGGYWWVLDKWRLGPMRLVSFGIHVAFFVALARVLAPIGRCSVLTYLGKRSMPVFCGHIGIALLSTGFVEHYKLSDTISYVLLAVAIGGLYLAGYLSSLNWGRLAFWRKLRPVGPLVPGTEAVFRALRKRLAPEAPSTAE